MKSLRILCVCFAAALVAYSSAAATSPAFYSTFVLISLREKDHRLFFLTTAAAFVQAFDVKVDNVTALRCWEVKEIDRSAAELRELWLGKNLAQIQSDGTTVFGERTILTLVGDDKTLEEECSIEIENEADFKPAGPGNYVGTAALHIRLRDVRWRSRVAACLILDGFEVTYGGYGSGFTAERKTTHLEGGSDGADPTGSGLVRCSCVDAGSG